MRFRTILFTISAAAVTFPCLVMGYLQYVSVQSEFAEADRTREQISRLVSERLDAKVESAVSVVTAASEVFRTVREESADKLSAFLDELRGADPDVLNIHYDDAASRSLAFSPKKNSRGESNIGVLHADREHWKNLDRNQPISISGLVHAVGAADQEIVNITKPIFADGQFIGLAVAALDLQKISQQVLEDLNADRYRIAIFDQAGKIIFSSGGSVPIQNFPTLSRKDSKNQSLSFSNEELYGYIRPLAVTNWSVGVFSRHIDRQAVLNKLFLRNALVWLGTFLTALLIGFAASVSVARAVDKLSRQMMAGRSLPDQSEQIKSPKELVQLQRTYGRMQGRLTQAQTRLKELNEGLKDEVAAQVRTIRRQEAKLQALFSDMNEGIVLFGGDDKIRFANPAASRLLKLSEPTEQQRFIDAVLTMKRGGEKRGVFPLEKAELELRLLEADEQDRGRFGVFVRDATSEIQIDRLKDELIGVAAHELKTPLAAMRLEAEVLKNTLTRKEDIEGAQSLLDSADEMKSLISCWLDVAKLQSGSYRLSRELCLIRPIISKALRRFDSCPDFKSTLRIEPDARAGYVDKLAFSQIMLNLLSNAYKYRKPESTCKVTIEVRKAEQGISLSIRDNGIGVETAEIDKIFDRFYQVKMGSDRRVPGAGLGLYITKELTELHGGSIRAESRLGEGTIFELFFPLPDFGGQASKES